MEPFKEAGTDGGYMQPDYVRIELKPNSEYVHMKHLLPDAICYPLFYQPGRMRMAADQLGDFQGIMVELPVSAEELHRVKEGWLKAYLNYIEHRLHITDVAFFVNAMLSDVFLMGEAGYETELKLLLLKDMAEHLLRKHRIARQEARVVIADDGTWHLPVAVYQLVQGLNHLTVITERTQELEPMGQALLGEYGLAVTFTAPKDMREMKADLMVNLIQEKEKVTTRMKGRCILIDFGYTDKKAVKLSQMNTGLQIYHTVKLKSVQDTVTLKELSQIMYYKEALFRQFVTGALEQRQMEELLNLWDRYFVEMVRVY